MGEPLDVTRLVGDGRRVDTTELTALSLSLSPPEHVPEKDRMQVYWRDLYVDGPEVRETAVPLSEKLRISLFAQERSVDRVLFGVDSTAKVGIQRQVGKGIWVGPEAGVRTFTDVGGGLQNQFFVGVGVSFKTE